MTVPGQRSGVDYQEKTRQANRESAERQYIAGRMKRMYEAALEADKASAGWNARSAELDQLLAARNLNWSQRRLERARDPELEDWFSKWSFWERETKRNAQIIEAMKSGRELLGLRTPLP